MESERCRVQELKDAMVSHRRVGKDLASCLKRLDAETSRLEVADACSAKQIPGFFQMYPDGYVCIGMFVQVIV